MPLLHTNERLGKIVFESVILKILELGLHSPVSLVAIH